MAADEPLICEVHEVALGNLDEHDFNTIVLSGVDVVVPVELDLDGDPLQDDLVRLRSEDGYFDAILGSSDPDVRADVDGGYLEYEFRLVPPGVYRVSVLVGERWVALQRLVVKRDGVYVDGQRLDDAAPEQRPAAAPEDDELEDDEPNDPHAGCGH